ncbi:MAG: hypothetical protein JWM34_5043 [Ilumatobacteraceae bacterium]|nr:hypothetical protein [Ilumatobacteraceae bacterium]
MHGAAPHDTDSHGAAATHDSPNAAEAATAELVAEHPALTTVGRIGWLTKGLVYLIAGVLAVVVALDAFGWDRDGSGNGSGGEASPTGALKSVAQRSLGGPLLVALAVGLLTYSGWRLLAAAMPGQRSAKVVVTRIGYVISAIMYTSFAFTALKLVVSDPATTNGNTTVSDISASVMRHFGGRIAIALVGLGLGGAAISRADKGRRADVTDEMDLTGVSERRLTWIHRLGAIGEIGRGLALAMIGFFLVRSALDYDPHEATGLDGALRRASTHVWTKVMVPIVAAGFVCYGVYCLVTFTRRRFEAPA